MGLGKKNKKGERLGGRECSGSGQPAPSNFVYLIVFLVFAHSDIVASTPQLFLLTVTPRALPHRPWGNPLCAAEGAGGRSHATVWEFTRSRAGFEPVVLPTIP